MSPVSRFTVAELIQMREHLADADKIIASIMLVGDNKPAKRLLTAFNDARALLDAEAARLGAW